MVEAQNQQPSNDTASAQSTESHNGVNGSAGTGESSADNTDEVTVGPGQSTHTNENGAKHPTSTDTLQATLTELVSKEVAQYAPLLIGKYYVQDKRAVWAGRWGMTEAAFGPNGVTSAFEMKSDEDVYVRVPSGDSSTLHPVFVDSALAKSSRLDNVDAEDSHPAFIGYECDPTQRSAMPFDCKYSGFFQIQAVKGKPQTVTEKSVDIRFVHNASRPSQFYVSGLGENKFGVFNLVGLLDKETSEMRLYKIYKPKEKEKRTFPKRARAVVAKAAAPAPTAAVKLETAVVAAPAAPAVAKVVIPVPPPAPVAPPAPLPTFSAARPSVSTPMGSDTSAPSPFTVSRGRSERKRIIPAHLRDENLLDHDHVPASLKKCLAILKGIMANPKAGPFLAPVDPVALGIPDYFNVIKEPMDLGTIRQNLEGGFYDDAYVFIEHVRLVFDNAMLYNAAHSQVHIFAAKLAEDFEKRIKNLSIKSSKDKYVERSYGALSSSSSIIKLKRERKGETMHSTKKIKGGRGAKGNTKRVADEGLIMSLKEDIERLKATLEQLQPAAVRVTTPKPSKGAARPFKMEDLTEEELNEPMSQTEKARLSEDIRQLPQDKINRVLQIIAESVPVSKLTNENDEVEIDINSFDSRCLRMLEGYVRENGIGRKRKRPVTKRSSSAGPVGNRLNSAKVAAVNIRQRKEHLKHQLASIEGAGAGGVAAIGNSLSGDVDMDKANQGNSSSDSSSSSSDSSDSDSESDSESDSDGAAPLHRSPSLTGGPTLSQVPDSARDPRKLRDDTSREPVRVENRTAWKALGQKESSSRSLMLPEENTTSSLWNSARSREQEKQQKLQQIEQERNDELAAQRRREQEQREREKAREREELQRRKQEEEAALRLARDRVSEVEQSRSARRAIEREKVLDDEGFDDHHEHTLTEDLESFSSSSFL